MGSPTIFSGRRTKLLTADGILTSANRTIDFDGDVNYIANGGAEVATTGWATFADAAASRPVDGTGGSPATTFTRSTSSPLRGQASFLWTKSANNRQGEGFSYAFTIDTADQAKPLQISLDYAISSGTYAGGTSSTDSDMIVYLYDVTNSLLIEPAPIKLDGAVVGQYYNYRGSFQTSSNSTSYRLIVYTATTSASAYTLQFDNIKVSPVVSPVGNIITDWVSFTPVITWTGGVGTVTGKWRRVGDSMECDVAIPITGSVTAVPLDIAVPAGYTIDTAKLTSTTDDYSALGTLAALDSGTGSVFGSVAYRTTTQVRAKYVDVSSTVTVSYRNIDNSSPVTWANNDRISTIFRVPIVGWSSAVTLSSEADTRVVAFRAQGLPTGTLNGSSNTTIFGTTSIDTHGAYNATTGTYTVPIAGYYAIQGQVVVNATYVINNENLLTIVVNGARVQTSADRAQAAVSYLQNNIAAVYLLKAGDTVVLQMSSGATSPSYSGSVTADAFYFAMERISGPALIAASESVNARYNTSTTTITSSPATIVYTSKSYDSHNAYNTTTGLYTVPVAGKYAVSGGVYMAQGSASVGNLLQVSIYKNGAAVRSTNFRQPSTNTSAFSVDVYDEVSCIAGDTLNINALSENGTPTIGSAATINVITVSKIGN